MSALPHARIKQLATDMVLRLASCGGNPQEDVAFIAVHSLMTAADEAREVALREAAEVCAEINRNSGGGFEAFTRAIEKLG